MPHVFARASSLPDPNLEGRSVVLRGLLWGLACSALLWFALFVSWREWGWWGPPAALCGGVLIVVAVALAFGRRER